MPGNAALSVLPGVLIFAHARTCAAFALPAAGPVSHRAGARLRTRRAAQGPETSCRDYPPACRPSGCSRRQAGNDIP